MRARDGLRAEQALAGVGRCDAAGGAGQQAHADPRFQPSHRMAESRLRGAEPRGRSREAALVGDHHEGVQVDEVLALH